MRSVVIHVGIDHLLHVHAEEEVPDVPGEDAVVEDAPLAAAGDGQNVDAQAPAGSVDEVALPQAEAPRGIVARVKAKIRRAVGRLLRRTQ